MPATALTFTLAQVVLSALVVLPFMLHRLVVTRWEKRGLPPLPKGEGDELPNLTLVLPTWNEGLIIEGKLQDIADQDYPRDRLEIIIIDADSDDDTIALAEGWLERNLGVLGDAVSFIIEEERLGKSFSINRAFAAARPEAEVLMMSDVDCRLSPGVLEQIGRRFLDSDIGAVTARQQLLNPTESRQTAEESTYRDLFAGYRIGESCGDSTPIFHGECSAYRRQAIAGHKLVEKANADDSQMAVLVRRNGFRAIYDQDIVFFELAPPDSESQRVQKIRRAQGLVRHFWRNRDTWFRRRHGEFGWTMGAQGWMHIVAPWLVLFGFLAGFGVLGLLNTSLLEWQSLHPLVLAMVAVDLLVLLLLLCGAARLPVPLSGLAWTFLVYMFTLWRAQLLIIGGRSLHRWEQVSAVREQMAAMESED